METAKLLNCKETARYLGLTESALRKRIFLRQIKGLIRLGGRIYFDRDKLDRFIDEIEMPIGGDRRGDR